MFDNFQLNKRNTKSFFDKNGNSMLHKAIKENKFPLLFKTALFENVINQQNRSGYSALHYATKHGNKLLIEALLQCGVDPGLKTKLGQSAKDLALNLKRYDIADLIDSYSPGLYHTILSKDTARTIDLLKQWVNLTNIIKAANLNGNSEVFKKNLAEMALDYYLNQNLFIHLVAADEYELVHAFASDNEGFDQMKLSFFNCIHPNNGSTPLRLAILNENVQMVELLLQRSADPTIRLNDGTPLTHFAWSINSSFVILLAILKANESTWHMRSPDNGLTILFTLAHSKTISAVHIHKILSITQCMTLQDRDHNNLDFYEFCELHNRHDLIDSMWESIVEMLETRSGKLHLIRLATALPDSKILCVPKPIFKRLYSDTRLEAVLKMYENFMLKTCCLKEHASYLFEAVRSGDLAKTKLHNVADFIDQTGRSALHEAILYDKFEIAQWLVAERPSLVSISDSNNWYPFHYAYGMASYCGNKYVHLLSGVTKTIEQDGLTDMNNCIPSSLRMNLIDEIKKIE